MIITKPELTEMQALTAFAKLQAVMMELHGAPASLKEQIAKYLEDESTVFQEESELEDDEDEDEEDYE
jgi:hypothetical protein